MRKSGLFVFLLFVLLFLLSWQGTEAQSGPVQGCSENWQGDISLRGNSWHHRGTVVGVPTTVSAGFLIRGEWVPPAYIYYGEGGVVSCSSLYTTYTWRLKGAYTIRIYLGDCYFDRTIWVASRKLPQNSFSLSPSQKTHSVSSPQTICGVSGDYVQNPPQIYSVNYFLEPLEQNFNLYRGQLGGLEVAWMPTVLNPGDNSFSVNGYSVNFAMASQFPQLVWWKISTEEEGDNSFWDVSKVMVYEDCRGTHSSPPSIYPFDFALRGYVEDREGNKLAGAKVRVGYKKGDCYGNFQLHTCGEQITEDNGFWKISCENIYSSYCILIDELADPPGYQDVPFGEKPPSYPSNPPGFAAWEANRVVWKRPQAGDYGSVIFYDQSLTPTPTPPPVGTIKGTIWEDKNGNKTCDPGEVAVEGVTMRYTYSRGGDTVLSGGGTCGDTNYQFNNVPAYWTITVWYDENDPALVNGGYQPLDGFCPGGTSDPTKCEVKLTKDEVKTVSFSVTKLKSPWFQVKGGGMQVGGSLNVEIPDEEFLIVDGDNQQGSLITAQSSLPFSSDKVSSSGWLVLNQEYNGPHYNLKFFSSRLSSFPDLVTDIPDEVTTLSSLASKTGVLSCDASQCSVDAGEKVILRRQGTGVFYLDRNIVVVPGGFFALLSKGELQVKEEVTRLEGIFLTEDDFVVESGNNQLIINGVVAVVGSEGKVYLNRDLQEGNETSPAIVFNYRPDFIVNMPFVLWKARHKINELLP
ncbi:hypothetical protein J7J95_01445 [bacterium]|nr:hypothetical protein [bacterium]